MVFFSNLSIWCFMLHNWFLKALCELNPFCSICHRYFQMCLVGMKLWWQVYIASDSFYGAPSFSYSIQCTHVTNHYWSLNRYLLPFRQFISWQTLWSKHFVNACWMGGIELRQVISVTQCVICFDVTMTLFSWLSSLQLKMDNFPLSDPIFC